MCCYVLQSSVLLESPSSHQHGQQSRFKPKPRAPDSSSGGSASSTPHGMACPGSSSASTPQLQPHPPQSSRKAAKPPMSSVALASSFGSTAASLAECSSPVDSPRMSLAAATAAAAAAANAAASGGCDAIGGSSGGVYARRSRYSMSGIAASGEGIVGSFGSTSSGALFGPGSGRGVGGSTLMRSSSGLVGADSSTPTSPVPNLATRQPSSGGGSSYLSAKLDGGALSSMGSGPLTGDGSMASVQAAVTLSSSARDSSSSGGGGALRDLSFSSSAGVAPLLSGRESYSGGGNSSYGSASSPRGSLTGGSEGGAAVAAAATAAATAAAAAAGRPSSGKRTVCLLVDAVRSRDDTQLADILSHCMTAKVGPNDRHPTTDRTPLHEAVWLGSTSMVKLLLEAGSDPNMGHPKEGSPLLQVRGRSLLLSKVISITGYGEGRVWAGGQKLSVLFVGLVSS